MRRDRRTKQSKTRDGRRAEPVFGLGDDKGRYWRCHICGWINDKEENPLAFAGGYAGNYRTRVGSYSFGGSNTVSITTDDTDFVLIEVDAAGDEKPEIVPYYVSPVGCPLCGTRNIKT